MLENDIKIERKDTEDSIDANIEENEKSEKIVDEKKVFVN